jgi:hypothetical protein
MFKMSAHGSFVENDYPQYTASWMNDSTAVFMPAISYFSEDV